jgi:Helix-turn-helix domain
VTEGLTSREVSERWRISEKTLANWRSAGSGPPYAKFGASVRYPLDKFERWLEAHMSRPAKGSD